MPLNDRIYHTYYHTATNVRSGIIYFMQTDLAIWLIAKLQPCFKYITPVRTVHSRIILDIDCSESPVHGQQEAAAYNGHFECVCYHPLFCFNQCGDCERAVLRPGNVHSAEAGRNSSSLS